MDLTSNGGSSFPTSGGQLTATAAKTNGSASDDLLQLSGPNPFIQNIVNQSFASQPVGGPGMNLNAAMANPFQASNPGMMMGGMMQPPAPQQPVMGLYQPPLSNPMMPLNNNQKFDAFGDVIQPNVSNGNMLNPMNKQSNGNLADRSQQDAKVLSKDLDSSLAQLADNLDINNKNKTFGKNHQWNPSQQQNNTKTGGQNWKGGPPATVVPPQAVPMANAWNPGLVNQSMGMPPMGVAPPMNAAAPMGSGWMGANPFGAPTGPMTGQPNMMMQPNMMQQTNIRPTVASANPFDLL